jgi:hypothetical protein
MNEVAHAISSLMSAIQSLTMQIGQVGTSFVIAYQDRTKAHRERTEVMKAINAEK